MTTALAIRPTTLPAVPRSDPSAATERLVVTRWSDEVTQSLGHDARSAYVERFWLGILGPSSTWLLRSLAYGLSASPDGFELDVQEMARVLGLGDRLGRQSPMQRSIARLCLFELARRTDQFVVVRHMVPWLEPRQVRRLSPALQAEHAQWEELEMTQSPCAAMRRRAASLAMSTVRTGGSTDDAEHALIRTGAHPSLTRSMAEWAWTQHTFALAAD